MDVQHKIILLVSLHASILAALGLSVLLLQEQQRSHRASDLATLYLLAAILCDAVLVAIPSKIAREANTSRPVLLRCCMHSALMMLESCSNRDLAFGDPSKYNSPEELCGVMGRLLFTWINPIILRGYRSMLGNQDMPPLREDMKPESTRKAILRTWSQRG